MPLRHQDEYRDPDLSRPLIDAIRKMSSRPVNLMEVCGTHTMSIFRHGIRDVLPETIRLLSGPGCPVCVTAQPEIDAFIAYARVKDTIVTTFGDLMRVPGTESSLQKEKAAGQTPTAMVRHSIVSNWRRRTLTRSRRLPRPSCPESPR